jgi:hypothetical protein
MTPARKRESAALVLELEKLWPIGVGSKRTDLAFRRRRRELLTLYLMEPEEKAERLKSHQIRSTLVELIDEGNEGDNDLPR